MRRLLKRAFAVFGDAAYERLANISVSHIHNLWRSESLAQPPSRVPDDPGNARGDRRTALPGPAKFAAWLRVDTVAQWQLVDCLETISERHLLPATPVPVPHPLITARSTSTTV